MSALTRPDLHAGAGAAVQPLPAGGPWDSGAKEGTAMKLVLKGHDERYVVEQGC